MDKKKLDFYFTLLESSILCYQHSITGLIPSSSKSSHAWVRDNTYASLSIWGLSLVYRKLPDVDEDRCRSYELEKCVVKLMRGILICYMKQSDKVELLKKTQNPIHSLHAKFDSTSYKTVVGDLEWGHLQIDAISVFLLILAQMTAAGLRIIWTLEEVAFIQNLVFCIEHAYRIPDYGIWERGDKTNHGLPELNTTSVGMAKAALEALTDLDLFGADGSYLSTIRVSLDECEQCNIAVKSMLPRESNSKETDAGLLSILTYPGFSVTDDELIESTRSAIIRKLLGRYGCRRFLRDGFRTAREDVNRLYYEPWELRMFDGIECEWPMFFAWLVIDASFREDFDDADRYMQMLQEVVIPESSHSFTPSNSSRSASRRPSEITTQVLSRTCCYVPESYSLPIEAIDAEIAHPHTQTRVPVGALPHIWGQSLYILASIIYEGLLLPGEIDPLGRRMVTEPKPDLSVQVVLVAEDNEIKQQLMEYQVEVQTFEEIYNEAGINIYPAKILGQLYRHLGKKGACEKLSLSGRSTGEIGIFSTSQFYRLGDETLAFLPQFFDHHAFYLNLDIEFLLDCFRTCIGYLKHAWTSPGRPLLLFPIYRRYFRSDRNDIPTPLSSAIKKIASGYMNATRVILGTLKDFEETSCLRQIDFSESALSHDKKQLNCVSLCFFFLIFLFCLFSKTTLLEDILQRAKSITNRTSQRRITLNVRADSLTGDENHFTVSPGDSMLTGGGISPVVPELDSFERHTMRRKSMALAHAVSLDLFNRNTDQINPTNSSNYSGTHSRRASDGRSSTCGLDSTDWLNSLSPDQLVKRLRCTDNLAEQVEILGRLHQLRGLDWNTGIDPTQPATVRSLLKEVYERATQTTSWFLLRYTAGLLGKRADSLAKSLADILVLQKQVTVGLPPEPREKVIDAPLSPDQLCDLIQEACGEDSLMTILTQEILIYLSMFARTQPQKMENILRLRIGLIIQMMAAELARGLGLTVEDSLYALFSMRPIDTKRLLHNLLSGEDMRMVKTSTNQTYHRRSTAQPIKLMNTTLTNQDNLQATLDTISGSVKKRSTAARPLITSRKQSIVAGVTAEAENENYQTDSRSLWSRRRKIDGALNRAPPGFYKRVYITLTHMQGLSIGNLTLSHNLTKEMTMGEHKFALTVEHVCTMVSTPEYRQLIIEAIHVLGSLMMHDVDNRIFIDCIVKVEDIVEKANNLFLIDQVKYGGNATLCCAKSIKQSGITDLTPSNDCQTPRRQSTLTCHGLHNICQRFYDTPPAGKFGTMSYMVRAVSELLTCNKCFNPDKPLPINCNVQ
ncbi:phosphorylase B kinase alpha, kpb1, putative [Schistosoma mansoni]|uniref:phosphorylase B kinase alpha, kpb1, putative n=1 Tax=Schistosoma mansoni TaxID=6183 RepID=UPI0001A63AB6|nr:phosphorylase B kinase alpha, kpb1, putative [Schistosoma mansoni]|eukprot:XP_018645642.1 phosphorylase B kinase alpha, kpb1, putative [Schistosoma mansoni]